MPTPTGSAERVKARSVGLVRRAGLDRGTTKDSLAAGVQASSNGLHPCPAASDRQAAGGRVAAGRGLVEQSTSGPGEGLCPRRLRLQRMRKGLRTAAPLTHAAAHRDGFRAPVAWMLTATYARPDAYAPRQWSDCLRRLRRWANEGGFDLAGYWVAEMQEKRYRTRGERAIHYHVIVWLPAGVTPPKLDAEGYWTHGMTRRDKVHTSADGYLMKYATKGTEVPLPKGARLFGVFGLGQFRRQYTHARRPAWLRECVRIGDRVRRCSGGGWTNLETGEVLRSPWRVAWRDGRLWISLRAEGDSS